MLPLNINSLLFSRAACFPCTILKHQLISFPNNIQNKMQRLSKNVEKSIKIVENAGKYQSIDLKTRKTLIEMVLENGFSIYRAAKVLGMNHSTAKAIMRKYRNSGSVFCRKTEQYYSSLSQDSLNEPTGNHCPPNKIAKKLVKKDGGAAQSHEGPKSEEPSFNTYPVGIFFGFLPINVSAQYCLYASIF